MSVNSEMTAIADLIRGLRGVSGKMGLDAMKGHLQDEQDGLDSALTALAEKGVTVPDGTKVDGLAALIAAIEAGGGSGGDSGFTWGTVVPETTTSMDYVAIEHGLGKRPACFVIFVMPDGNATVEADRASWCFSSYNKGSVKIFKNGASSKSYTEYVMDVSKTQEYWDATSKKYTSYAVIQQVNENSFVVNSAMCAVAKTHVWLAFGHDFV